MSRIRISEASRRTLQELSQSENKSMQAVLEQAIEAYRRQYFLEGLHADFAALREDEHEWRAEQDERAAWDATANDGGTAYLLSSPKNALRLQESIAELETTEKSSPTSK